MNDALKQVTDACAAAAAATDPVAYYNAYWWGGVGLIGGFAIVGLTLVGFVFVLARA